MDGVVAIAAVEVIVAVSQGVAEVRAADDVAAQAAADRIVTLHAEDHIGAVAADDRIVSETTNETLDVSVDAITFSCLAIIGGSIAHCDDEVVGAGAVVGRVETGSAADGIAA